MKNCNQSSRPSRTRFSVGVSEFRDEVTLHGGKEPTW